MNQNISTVFIGGSTGESHSLNIEERLQLTSKWNEVAARTGLKVIVHVGSNCLADCKRLASQAAQLNALAISALPPCYFKPQTIRELIKWCAEIAAAAPETPFYFYDVPALTTVKFSMSSFLAEAADRIPSLSGIKFTNPDLMEYQLCLHAHNGGYDIPWATDESLLGALALGATAAVGSSYNFAAPIYQRMLNAYTEGDLAAARQEQFRSVQLITLLGSYGYLGAAKAVMNLLGMNVGPARLPNTRLSAHDCKELHQELEHIGFFDWIRMERPLRSI